MIIADDIDGEAMATLVVNKFGAPLIRWALSRRVLRIVKEMLEDIAILTGGKVVSEEVGIKLESVEMAMLGRARR